MARFTFEGRSYEVVAAAFDRESVYYREFGSHQGEWLLIARDEVFYYFYKDWYGSCGNCDPFTATFGYTRQVDRDAAREFSRHYPPFLEAPQEAVRRELTGGAGTVEPLLPANLLARRAGEVPWEEAVREVDLRLRLTEGLEVDARDVLGARNQELRREGMEAVGAERFVRQTRPAVIDADGSDQLLWIDPADKGLHHFDEQLAYLYVKDASTERRYLLRVPPDVSTVREAKSWTFDVEPEEWNPLQET